MPQSNGQLEQVSLPLHDSSPQPGGMSNVPEGLNTFAVKTILSQAELHSLESTEDLHPKNLLLAVGST